MTISMRNWKHIRGVLASIALSAFAAIGVSLTAIDASLAQSFPSKVIKFVLPLRPGRRST